MLQPVFIALDAWIETENTKRQASGILKIAACEIKVIGQTALIEANLLLHVPATMDVDVFANYEYPVRKKFEELLQESGKVLDPVGNEAWMPEETEYLDFLNGKWVKAYLAKVEYVMLPKAKKAPEKNMSLLTDYIASQPSDIFFILSKKHGIDLNFFLE